MNHSAALVHIGNKELDANAPVGDFKLVVDAWFSPSGSGNGTSATFVPFMLEILH